MPETKTPRLPRHLGLAGRALWRSVVTDYLIEEWQLAILAVAAEAADRIQEARAEVHKDGLTLDGRFGLKSHPALAVERDSKLLLLRSLRELALDPEAIESVARPPMIGNGRRYGRGA